MVKKIGVPTYKYLVFIFCVPQVGEVGELSELL